MIIGRSFKCYISGTMIPKLTSAEIKELVQMFKGCSSDCLTLYYLLKNSVKTENTWPRVDVYVDSEDLAKVTSVVAIWYANDDRNGGAETYYFLYALDVAKLKAFLRGPCVLDLKKHSKVNFVLLKAAHDKSIRELLKKELCTTSQFYDSGYSYVLDNINESIINMATKTLPRDFKVGPLQRKHAGVLREVYTYGQPPPLSRFENTIKHQQHLAMFNQTGEPISWAVVKEYGEIGMTYTMPRYRRQGFASIVTSKLVQMVLDSNEIPLVAIAPSNEASQALHTKLGFQRRGEMWAIEYFIYNQDMTQRK
ncbi:glycine N-acyltransferase-like [Ptychodera flava]|uniref:glycine N-acyltransferase-like n=1 Tax=Ptychodera flava TaxID=63121 RepID=UPI00396A1AFC